MFPTKIDLGLCPICKGSGFKKEADYSRSECICEETGNKFFLFEPDKTKRIFDRLDDGLIGICYIRIDYKDKLLFDRIKYHFEFGICHYNGILKTLYINGLHRIEPFYSLKDYNLNNYNFPPLEDPLFPFKRK